MKVILILALTLLTLNLHGQIQKGKVIGMKIKEKSIYSENDTIPVVINVKNIENQNTVLWILNGEPISEQVAHTINPNVIEELEVKKGSGELNKGDQKSKIYITTKENYNPKLISLNELKEKYLSLKDKTSTLFMLDERVITSDYDEFKVDEKYILKIEVQPVKNRKEMLDMYVIKLITRTKENLAKANTIRLKGNSL